MRHDPVCAIGNRRWWFGGGFDVIEGTRGAKSLAQAWPEKIAWFRERYDAECFVAMIERRSALERA